MQNNKEHIRFLIEKHVSLTDKLYDFIPVINEIAAAVISSLKKGGKILLMGNGGSAADCQHLAAEFVGRFQAERTGLPAIALTTDTSVLTSVANDYGFDAVFKRQIEALCSPEDAVIGISTSGNSANIIAALEKAHKRGAATIALTGRNKTSLDDLADFSLKIPSVNTARIQEMHILCGHIICEIVEDSMIERKQR